MMTHAVSEFVAAIEAARAAPEDNKISDDELASAITAAIRLYAARVDVRDIPPPPITMEASATEVLVAASEMIRTHNINGFDLMMWHDCTRRR